LKEAVRDLGRPAVAAFVALTTLSLGSEIPAQEAATVLERAERAYRAARSFQAEFRQTIINPMLGGPEESRGVLFLEPPRRFAMRFTEPAGDRIVADGTWLWIYAPTSVPDQVIRQPVPEAGTATPNLVAQFVDRPLERYTARFIRSEVIGGETVDVVRLDPRRPDLPFRSAHIAVARSDGLLRRIALVELSGQRRTITFENIRTDAAIVASEFRFEPAPGVRVVTP
jgi:outer membrane lipoprotein carrier protein